MKFSHLAISKRRPMRLVMIAATFIVLGRMPVWAQGQPSQTPDSHQMQKKLDELENEIRELRQQINSQQTNQPAQLPAPKEQPQAPATNEQPQLPVPNGQLSEGNVPSPTDQETEQPETVPSKGTLDFYGFAMLDSGHDFGVNDPAWFDVVRPTKLNSFPHQFGANGNTYFSVRQTRFGVKSATPTPLGNLKTIFEFELFGTGVDAGQTTFRLRHAYGQLGKFGGGQTWSAFMDIDVFPNTVEYWGPNGMVFFRNVQVRWEPVQGKSNLVFALERPGASADGGTYSGRVELQNVVPQFKWPDLSGHGRFARNWGYVQIGAIVRKIAWVDQNSDRFNLSGTAVGWGVNVSSNLNVTEKDVAKLSFVYGDGVENYMNDAPVDVGVENTFSNPTRPIKGVALPVLGAVAFLDHSWNDKYTSSIGYSLVNINNSSGQNPSDYHQGHYAVANLLYHPLKRVTLGPEFQFGRRVNARDGYNTNDYRLQFSMKYDWSKGFVY
jgi:hypothetical protein